MGHTRARSWWALSPSWHPGFTQAICLSEPLKLTPAFSPCPHFLQIHLHTPILLPLVNESFWLITLSLYVWRFLHQPFLSLKCRYLAAAFQALHGLSFPIQLHHKVSFDFQTRHFKASSGVVLYQQMLPVNLHRFSPAHTPPSSARIKSPDYARLLQLYSQFSQHCCPTFC